MDHQPASVGDKLEAESIPNPAKQPKILTPWYQRYRVGVEIGPTGANSIDPVFMSRATGKEIIGNLLKAGAQYAVIFSKDQNFAYYPSRVARNCPGLGGRDLLRECLDEARRHDLPIIAYCQVQYDSATWEDHPEWRMKDVHGEDLHPRLCYNSEYLGYLKAVVAEMMQYEIVGFHFDMLDYGLWPPLGCWCGHCQRKFKQLHGVDLPVDKTWDDLWHKALQFRYDANASLCKELDHFVKDTRPELSVDFNYHGYPPFSWEAGERPVQHALNGDFVTAEGLPWVFGHYNPSLMALFLAGVRPGTPYQAVSSRFNYNYHDYTIRPQAEMTWEVLTYMAHGAQCTIVDKSNYDGTLDGVAFERLGPVFSAAQKKNAFFGHEPVATVGIYYSCLSRDRFGRENGPKYFGAFVGAHKALVQAHIGMGILTDEALTLERLQTFSVIYLPNVAVLTNGEIELLTRYVREGGRLLITGLAGIGDERGELTGPCGLEDLIGARFVRVIMDQQDNYLTLPSSLIDTAGAFLLKDIAPDWPMLTWGPLCVYQPTTAQAFGEIVVAFKTAKGIENVWNQLMSPDMGVGPAVMVNQVGQGTVVTLACAPDAAWAGPYRMPEHRNLIRNAIQYLDPIPTVSIEAPLSVEAMVTRDMARKRLIVHLLQFCGPATSAMGCFEEGRKVYPALMEETLTYKARIRINVPFENAYMAEAEGALTMRGPELELVSDAIHACLVIEGAEI